MASYNRQNSVGLFYHRFASGMSSPEVMMQGPLLKLGSFSFKLRYFVLYKNRKLAYWPSQTEEIYGKDPIGVLEMHEVRSVKIVNKPPRQKKNNKKSDEGDAEDEIGDDILIDFEKTRYFCFELTTKYRTFLLCCDDALHFNDWIMHLNNAVFGKKLYKGWFTKQGAKAKSWRKRWFVVYDTLEMRYYENQKGTKPKGNIMLNELIQIIMVLNEDKYPKHKNVIELITPERIWSLSAPSKNDRQLWYDRLCNLVGLYRLNPIYNNYLSQYDQKTNSWTQRYFALTKNNFYYFQDSQQCEIAKSIAYFDKAKFNLGISKCGFIPIKLPNFEICDPDQQKLFNKSHLFDIDTSFDTIKLSAGHKTELQEWEKAFIKLKQMEHDDDRDDNKENIQQTTEDAFNPEMLANLKANNGKNKPKVNKKPSHSSSSSLNLSMVTHFPGFKKHKNNKPKMDVISDEAEVKIEESSSDPKDGLNHLGKPVEETRLPAPHPRKSTNKTVDENKTDNPSSRNPSSPRKKNKKTMTKPKKALKKKKKKVKQSQSYKTKPNFGGAGNAGKVDPFRRSKTQRSEYQRDRTKSRSLNEAMFNEMISGTSPPKKNVHHNRNTNINISIDTNTMDYFGNSINNNNINNNHNNSIGYLGGANSIATSYNPNRNMGIGNMQLGFDFKQLKGDSMLSAHSTAINMNGMAYTPQVRSAVGSIASVASSNSGYGGYNNNNNNNSNYYTTNRPIPMISPTPSRHGSFDLSMVNNVASTRNRDASLLSVTYNTGLRTSVSKSYNTDNDDIEISMTSVNDQQITRQHSDKLNAMQSMLATIPDPKIVSELMDLGFVSKEACEKAAISTNNRSTEEASQWLFNNLQDTDIKQDPNGQSSRKQSMTNTQIRASVYSEYGYITQPENALSGSGSGYDDDESISNISQLIKGVFEFQSADFKQKQNQYELNDEERTKISELGQASMRGDAYFDKQLWFEAIKEYTIALNEIDADIEAQHPYAYTYYCFRSECYRRLGQLNKAQNDTESWMELRWNRNDFDFIKGCDVGSKVYIDMKQYAKAKKLVMRGLMINPKKVNFQKRLKKLRVLLRKELNNIADDIDQQHLEYDGDEVKYQQDENENVRQSKQERAMTVISEWKELIENKTEKSLIKEAKKLKQCTTDIGECPCVKRVIVILRFYHKWCQTQETATILDRISIYGIINYLPCYSLIQLMNDYIHIKESHVDNLRQQRYEIFDYFINTLNFECQDNLDSSKCFLRNNRNKKEIDQNEDKFKKMYFNYSRSGEAHDIITMQILDSLYTYCLHSPQCVMMKLPQENQNKDTPQEEILNGFLSTPQIAMKCAHKKWKKLYKFKTNIVNINVDKDDDDDDDDDEDQKGDNDDDKDDDDDDKDENFVEMEELKIGKQMKYWTSFKKDNNYIKPKYKTLKREMMKNTIFKITEAEWFLCLLKANIFKKTYKGRQMIADEISLEINGKYDIPSELPIPITHLMVLLFYTNNIDLQYELKHRGFSLLSSDESFSRFKKRNREIANFSKILFECIRFYGYNNNHLFQSSAIFYHGFDSKILTDNFELTVNVPTLITLEPSSAMMICDKSKNSVIQFRAKPNSIKDCKLLDCSWLSDNPYHNTFITTDSIFEISDILSKYESNEIFINTILFFKKFVNGFYIQDMIHPKQIYQYVLLGLMSNMSEGYAKHSNIPKFMQSLFEYTVNKIDSIWIIKSQFEKLGNDLRTCFFNIDEDEAVTTGPFYDYWSEQIDLSVNLTQEYEWNIHKQDDLLHFWGLGQNEYMQGPQCNYVIVGGDDNDDDDDDSDNDNDDQDDNEQKEDNETLIPFIPIIKRSHSSSKENVSFGIQLKSFGEDDEYSEIKLQYNVYCTQLRYAMSNIATFDEEGQIHECIAFNINQIKTLNSFHFQISLRVLGLD